MKPNERERYRSESQCSLAQDLLQVQASTQKSELLILGGCWHPVAPKNGLRSLALKISITVIEESKPCFFDPNVLERNQHANILRQDLSTSSRSYDRLF